jgi:hypothetical protein
LGQRTAAIVPRKPQPREQRGSRAWINGGERRWNCGLRGPDCTFLLQRLLQVQLNLCFDSRL